MATKRIKIDRPGLVEFEIGNAVFTVDIFHAQAQINKFFDEQDENAWLTKVAEVIASFGGPHQCSGVQCSSFAKHIDALVKEEAGFFVKSASPPPNTDSTSSA